MDIVERASEAGTVDASKAVCFLCAGAWLMAEDPCLRKLFLEQLKGALPSFEIEYLNTDTVEQED